MFTTILYFYYLGENDLQKKFESLAPILFSSDKKVLLLLMMKNNELVDELEYSLRMFIQEIYDFINSKQNNYSNQIAQKLANNELKEMPSINKVSQNLFMKDLSIYEKLIIQIKEGANFPYKSYGKRNTVVSIKIHPDIPHFITSVSENHTKHSTYDSDFEVDISKYNLTNIIPVICVFDKLTNGKLELLGINYVELNKVKILDEKAVMFDNEWIDIYTRESRTYNGSVKLSMVFSSIKQNQKEILEKETIENEKGKNKHRKRISPNNIHNPKKEDKEVQTDEYNEEITPEQFDGDSGDINFAVISNKVNRFVFQTDEDLMKDDMFYRSEYEKVDINKVLQTETDNHLINLLQSSINFKDIPELTERKFVVTDNENGELLWNDGNDLVDEMNNEYEIKYHSYNPEKYSTYLEYNWDNGLNSIL